MKKVLSLLSLVVLLAVPTVAKANGIIVSNIVTGFAITNTLFWGPIQVYQISISGAAANTVNFYDSSTNTINYVTAAYNRRTNLTINVTNRYTNATYITDTSTNSLISTQIFLNANFSTNVAVAANTNAFPAVASLYIPAGSVTTLDAVDLNFVRGISFTTQTNATIVVYYRN